MERSSHAIVQTVPAQSLRVVLDTAAERGAPAAAICEAVGLDPRLLDDSAARVPLEIASDTYDEAARRTGDEAFGLHVAERSDFFAFDALGLAVPEEGLRPCRHRTEAFVARVVRMIELATGNRPRLRLWRTIDPDITVADVHTGKTGILHVGKQRPRRIVVTVDWRHACDCPIRRGSHRSWRMPSTETAQRIEKVTSAVPLL